MNKIHDIHISNENHEGKNQEQQPIATTRNEIRKKEPWVRKNQKNHELNNIEIHEYITISSLNPMMSF